MKNPNTHDPFISLCERITYAVAIAGWLLVVISMAVD